MTGRPLRFATFLAPNLIGVYQFIAWYVARRLGVPTELVVGTSYDQLRHEVDVGFVCGLAYIDLARAGAAPLAPLAAPVLAGPRYGGRPVYFSDVVVRRDSPFRSFADLRGRSWAYNEPLSQSGYGVTRHRLVELGETAGFFGRVVEAGYHERALDLVDRGEVDAAAVDSQVLEVLLRDAPALAGRVRVVDSFGPSTIQPVLAAMWLAPRLVADLRSVLLEMHTDPAARDRLASGLVERFVAVADDSYNDIRSMRDACERAEFLTLR